MVDNAAAFGAEKFQGFLRRQEGAENVQVELAVKAALGHFFERQEFIDASVVDQNVVTSRTPFSSRRTV